MSNSTSTTEPRSPITRVLARAPVGVLAVYAIIASFATYFCMYAFRKPFAAAEFSDVQFFGTSLDLKSAFAISQIIGYTLSKYIGIKLCSEVTRRRRVVMLVSMIVCAEAALLLFAILPQNYKFLALILNGLPLGMVWGLVVWYLEGRRISELLLAGLSCSFIIASGIVKDVGRALLNGSDRLTLFAIDLPYREQPVQLKVFNPFASYGEIPEAWMPFATGLLFFIPFLLAVFLLNQVPDPTREDELARTHREPMDGTHRLAFLKHFLPGLLMLFVAYFFLTAYRDFRDTFGAEVFNSLGYQEEPGIFSRSEVWVMFGVAIPLALLFLIRNNRWGLFGAYAIMISGTILLGVSSYLRHQGWIDGLGWMILIGLGSYLAYVPFGSVLFDRLIASTHVVGTAVFAIYVADALGYTGVVGVQLYKDFVESDLTRLEFLERFTYFMAALGTAMLIGSCIYFLTRHGKKS